MQQTKGLKGRTGIIAADKSSEWNTNKEVKKLYKYRGQKMIQIQRSEDDTNTVNGQNGILKQLTKAQKRMQQQRDGHEGTQQLTDGQEGMQQLTDCHEGLQQLTDGQEGMQQLTDWQEGLQQLTDSQR